MEEKAIGQEILSPDGVEQAHEEETGALTQEEGKRKRTIRPSKPFPNYSLRDVLRIPQAIAKNNAGDPWGSDQIATAVSMSNKSSTFYYYTTAARDYGLTTGTGRTKIMSSIYNAELILADLTEHNPNVLFELGLAIALKKKVAIIRAKGTSAIFDVDHSMRVLDYNSNLWKSTLEMDVSKLSQHLEATAESEETTYLDIFLS